MQTTEPVANHMLDATVSKNKNLIILIHIKNILQEIILWPVKLLMILHEFTRR